MSNNRHLRSRARMKMVWVLVAAACSVQAWSAEPSPSADEAYKRAVSAIEKRQENRRSATPEVGCPSGNRAGTVPVRRLPVEDVNGNPIRAEGAILHHWGGSIFIPHARPQDVVAVLQDYDHHAEIYAPDVKSSKLLDRHGEHYHVVHETLTRNVINVGLRIESSVDWSSDGHDGFLSHSTTIRVNEYEHAGTQHARLRTPQQAKGWMWAEDSWWRVAPSKDGACVTYETLALTRDIPWGFGWVLRPLVDHFPPKTVANMLTRTRDAVESREAHGNLDDSRGKQSGP